MEALAAFGLATNVLTFVEFAGKIISQTVKIYRNASQARDGRGQTDLSNIGFELEKHLRQLSEDDSEESELPRTQSGFKARQNLKAQKNSRVAKPKTVNRAETQAFASAADQEILRIAGDCTKLGEQMRNILERLKSSKVSLWNSFLEALRTVWSEDEIRSLQEDLHSHRQQITLLLVASIRDKVQSAQIQQNANHEDLYESTSHIRDKVDRLFYEQERFKDELVQAIRDDPMRTYYDAGRSVTLTLDPQHNLAPESRSRFEKGLLNWVCFNELDFRYEKIKGAYQETFEWIFQPSTGDKWSSFPAWLLSKTESLYWITGKPAAGKSTLMKFIYNDSRTMESLRIWANGLPLITCAFFFWNSGTAIQMSEEGMLRTFLHSALQQQPTLWSILFPSKMEEFILFTNPWLARISSDEIRHAFVTLIEHAGKEYKDFFFIDGLDEFGGKHNELVNMVKGLASDHIKTCVSSRPWPVFEDGFQQKPSLRLEALTYRDIKHYVLSNFEASRGFQDRQRETPMEAAQLIENIITKASGVFLWVTLVTDSLLKGASDGELVVELQRRLDELPEELEELFWKILILVEDDHRARTSQMLQITRAAINPLDLLTFSYADDPNPEIVSVVPFVSQVSDQAEARACNMRRRLKAFCKGLLDAEPKPGQHVREAEVAFLHRTVRDYLERPEVWSKFLGMTDESFNPHSRIFNGCMVRLKSNPTYSFLRPDGESLKEFWSWILRGMEYATRADPGNATGLQVNLLEQLDNVATELVNHKIAGDKTLLDQYSRQSGVKHWSATRKGGQLNTSFLNLAVQLQLNEYVRYEIQRRISHAMRPDFTTLLLQATLHYDMFWKALDTTEILKIVPCTPDVALIHALLRQGADPNHKIDEALTNHGNITGAYSAWQCHLREPERENKIWSGISKLFLDHGADPSLVIAAASSIPEGIVALAKEKQDNAKRPIFKALSAMFKTKRPLKSKKGDKATKGTRRDFVISQDEVWIYK